jgi:hypothetical protein
MRKLLLSVLASLTVSISSAFNTCDVVIVSGDTLNVAMDLDSAYLHFTENAKSSLFEGYTIQIFSGDRSGANAVRANIISLGFESDARMVYREPNFKIHIGSFPDVSSAERALVQWKGSYPDAFVLKTLVPWYELPTPSALAPSDTEGNE